MTAQGKSEANQAHQALQVEWAVEGEVVVTSWGKGVWAVERVDWVAGWVAGFLLHR